MKKHILTVSILIAFFILLLYLSSSKFYNFRFLLKANVSTPIYSGYMNNFIYVRKFVNGSNAIINVRNTKENTIVVLYFKGTKKSVVIQYSDDVQLDIPQNSVPIIIVYKEKGFLISYPIASYKVN